MLCSGCGYDLKAHSSGEKCPECGLEVDESIRFAQPPEMATQIRSVMLFVILICAGGIAWFYLFALVFNGYPNIWRMFLLVQIAPALAIGSIVGIVCKRHVWMWSTLFAWVPLAWGAVGLISAPIEREVGMLIWPAIGLAIAGAGVIGALIGRWLLTMFAAYFT